MAEPGRVPPELCLCRGCRRFVWPDAVDCPFCGGDLDELARDYEARQAAVTEAARKLRAALEQIGSRADR
jgi:hypothetical protein